MTHHKIALKSREKRGREKSNNFWCGPVIHPRSKFVIMRKFFEFLDPKLLRINGCGLGLFGVQGLDSKVDFAFPDEDRSGTGGAQETDFDGIAVLLRF